MFMRLLSELGSGEGAGDVVSVPAGRGGGGQAAPHPLLLGGGQALPRPPPQGVLRLLPRLCPAGNAENTCFGCGFSSTAHGVLIHKSVSLYQVLQVMVELAFRLAFGVHM